MTQWTSKYNQNSADAYRRIALCADLLAQYAMVTQSDWRSEELLPLILRLFSPRFFLSDAKSWLYDQIMIVGTSTEAELKSSMPWVSSDESQEFVSTILFVLDECRTSFHGTVLTSGDWDMFANRIASILMEYRYLVVHNTIGRKSNKA